MRQRIMSYPLAAGIAVTLCVSGMSLANDKSEACILLEKAIKAVGGEENLTKFKATSWKFKTRGYGPEGVASTIGECSRQGSDQYRCAAEWVFGNKRRKLIEVINRQEGWVRNPAGTFAIVEEGEFIETKTERLYLSWITTLVPLREKAFTLSLAGELKVGDRVTSCLQVSRDGSRDVVLCFDQESVLLVKSEMPIKVQRGSEAEIGKVLMQHRYYSNYKESKGIRYASKIATRIDGKLRSEVEVTEFTPHEKLEESTFTKP